jgi:hypothetical protein
MLSGEGVSATQETAFGAASMFNSIMMDQGAFWRNRETVDVNSVSFAGEPLQYAASTSCLNLPTKRVQGLELVHPRHARIGRERHPAPNGETGVELCTSATAKSWRGQR